MSVDLFLTCLIKILASTLATVLITYASILFAKFRGKIKDSRIRAYIKETVKAAEQIYPNEGKKMGIDKYQYVTDRVIEKFPELQNNDYLRSLIEGAVFALTKQLDIVPQKVDKSSNKDNISSY